MNSRTRSDVHVVTPQPKKSVSSVQIGHPRRGQRPALASPRVPTGQSLPRLSFELAIHLASNRFHQTAQGAQECERLSWIAAVLDDEFRQALLGFGVSGLRDKERHVPSVRLNHLTHTPPQNSPHESIVLRPRSHA
jgi:hypothetical protein